MTRPPGGATKLKGRSSKAVWTPGSGRLEGDFLKTHVLFETSPPMIVIVNTERNERSTRILLLVLDCDNHCWSSHRASVIVLNCLAASESGVHCL